MAGSAIRRTDKMEARTRDERKREAMVDVRNEGEIGDRVNGLVRWIESAGYKAGEGLSAGRMGCDFLGIDVGLCCELSVIFVPEFECCSGINPGTSGEDSERSLDTSADTHSRVFGDPATVLFVHVLEK
jgi:hypothetical protein